VPPHASYDYQPRCIRYLVFHPCTMDTKDPPSCDQTCLRFKKSRWPSSELPHRVSRLQRILISCSSKVVDGSQRIQNMDNRLNIEQLRAFLKALNTLGELMTSSVLHWKLETLTYRIYCLIRRRRQHLTNRENRLLHTSLCFQYISTDKPPTGRLRSVS
jgi:hypothetical protein